jgi:hypothetical protein
LYFKLQDKQFNSATDEEIIECFYHRFAPRSKVEWVIKLQETVSFPELRQSYKLTYFTLNEFILQLYTFLRHFKIYHQFATMYNKTTKMDQEDTRIPPLHAKENGYIKVMPNAEHS